MEPTEVFEEEFVVGDGIESNNPFMSQITDVASTSQQGGNEPPAIGMVFDSIDAAYQYYRDYAFFLGFGIKKRSGHNFHGERYRCKLCCNREGKPVEIDKEQASSSKKKLL